MEAKEEKQEFDLNSLLETLSPGQRDQFADQVAEVVRKNMYPLRPTKLELMLTERCNLRCDYCFLGAHGEQRDMTPEMAEKGIDYFLANAPTNDATLSIVHFGGEPLLNIPLMKHVMDYARKNAREGQTVTFQCTSNGTLIDDEAASFVAQYGVPILLSLDGRKAMHDRHRKFADGSPTFDKVMEGMQILRKYQPWIGSRITYTEETVHDLAEGVKWLNQNGICQFVIGSANGEKGWSEEALQEMERQWYEIADYYVKTRKEGLLPLRIADFEDDVEAIHNRYKNLWGCSAGRNSVCVAPDGTLYGCARFATLDNCKGRYGFGNVDEGITRWDYMRDLQDGRSVVRNKCHTCEYAEYCAGACPAAALEDYNNIYCADAAGCQMVKTKLQLLRSKPELSKVHKEYPIMYARKQKGQEAQKEVAEHIQPLQ